MRDDRFSPEEFGAAYQRFMEWVSRGVEPDRSPFKAMLTEHFGTDPATFPVTAESVALYDLPNLQLALDAYLERPDVDHRLVGFGGHIGFTEMSLISLSS